MGPFDDPPMLTQDLPFGGDDDAVGVDTQAHRPVGEGCGHAVPIAFEGYQACRRHPLGVFDEAVEGPPQRHQARDLGGMHIGNGAGQHTVRNLFPLRDALLLKPGIERIDVREGGHCLPQSGRAS